MKRTRKHSVSGGLWGFDETPKTVEKPVEQKRQRKPKIDDDEDGFLARHKGKDPLIILREFLEDRKKYVKTRYPEQTQVVLFELNLYNNILEKLIKNHTK